MRFYCGSNNNNNTSTSTSSTGTSMVFDGVVRILGFNDSQHNSQHNYYTKFAVLSSNGLVQTFDLKNDSETSPSR